MTKINYQLYDEDRNCIYLEHPTDIPPMVGDIMEFKVDFQKRAIFCKVIRRQYTTYNILIIILEKMF
jgi:hypothetical protein